MVTIQFPSGWTNASGLEEILSSSQSVHNSAEVTFQFCAGSKILIDAAVRLLSLLNQLDFGPHRVTLCFDDGEEGVMGYLNRMGFFDHLATSVCIVPDRPAYSGANLYRGSNPGLVEIARIQRAGREDGLPTRLADALANACVGRADAQQLSKATWTIFCELIDNVFSHSETPLDGYAALQVYSRGKSVQVAVSDSGVGIMGTLRPALERETPAMCKLTDTQLLVEVFRQGLSRHGRDRGCGLKGCAAKAIKYKAELDVRLPTTRVHLTPSATGYSPNVASCYEGLPRIDGTHICFTFPT